MSQRADMFIEPENDPREGGPSLADERTTLAEYLRVHRLTLELKCSGLEPADLARRSVEPSTLSLLGLVRHMADVERYWFRWVLDGRSDVGWWYRTEEDVDGAFTGAVGDPDVVVEAFRAWKDEIAFAERFVDEHPDLDLVGVTRRGRDVSMREILVHMIEEYARHNGHADLLRERIDGRIGL